VTPDEFQILDACPVCKRAHGYVEIDGEPRTWLCDTLRSEATVALPDGTRARRPRGIPKGSTRS
jgi:hypothetical protein